ncbi:MAG: DUF2190 family protein [Methyloceanibacter sp.]
MMTMTVTELRDLLRKLQQVRWGGDRRVRYEANGVAREVEFRSAIELRQAVGDLERAIAAAEGKPALQVVRKDGEAVRNFVQPGDVITLIAPDGGVLSGQPFLVGNIFAIATTDATEGTTVEGALVGCFELSKASGDISAGDRLFWDDTAKVIKNESAAGLYPVGVAIVAAAADTPTVRARLDGIAVEAVPET